MNKSSKKLFEKPVLQVSAMHVNENAVSYSQSELDNIESIVKPLLNIDELKAYSALTPDERAQYLSGFAANIKEWQDAKEAANNPQLQAGGMPGMSGMDLPDDGLDHWQPAKLSNLENSDGQSKTDNMVFSDLDEQMEKAQLNGNNAEDSIKNARNLQSNTKSPEEIANSAQSIADSALQISDAAMNAAKAAQDAVDQADANAQLSGKKSDVKNTDKAQVLADAAQNLANQAADAAEKAQELANLAQQAAEEGDIATALRKAKEAYDAAMDAANKMRGAQVNAKSAIRTAKLTSPNNLNRDNNSNISDNDINGMSGEQAAQNAQALADNAQQAADSAQNAADAAQEKADMDGSPKSQSAANKAQLAANDAQLAADNAQRAADMAKSAARTGDNAAAQQLARTARDHALSALQSAQSACLLAGLESQCDGVLGGENDYDTDPVLLQADTDFDPNDEAIRETKVDYDLTFGGNDFAGDNKEMIDALREIAKNAGQALDSDDYVSPEEYAGRKFQEAIPALREWAKHNQPGKDGNAPTYIELVMKELFESEIDWRSKIEDFLTDKAPAGKTDVWAKRRMGLDPSHPLYTGRYLHPNERIYEKKSGLAQVFFLVDASGSMGVRCGDGVNIFKHIMSELIQIELSVRIRQSAYASFNCGPIAEDDIFTWTYQDASDEDELMENFVLPVANGGTSAVDGIKSIQEYDEIYSTEEPWTLLIVVTDGGDNYKGLKAICNDPELVEHMIWVITATGDDWFKLKSEELKKQGVPEDHIICVDINKEWGVTREMVDKHNKK